MSSEVNQAADIEAIVCPSCDGNKTLTGLVRYAPGASGPPVLTIDCHRCNGTGCIPKAEQAWIEHGDKLRAARMKAGIGLRVGAGIQGMKPSELSNIEQGMVDNLSYRFDWSKPCQK